MEFCGVHFAPLGISFQRRLQTLAAASWMTLMVFGGTAGFVLSLYLLLFTSYWRWTAVYLFWIWVLDKNVSEKGGRPSKWVRSWSWWKYRRDYYPMYLRRLPRAELDPKKNYLFCCFPHGVLSTGVFNAFGCEIGGYKDCFPYHTPHIATLSLHYKMPFYRDVMLALGGVSSSAKSIDYILGVPGGGHVCVLVVGGMAEAQFCKPGSYKLVLNERKGFVKLALKNGTPLVPVISFGETDLFDVFEESWMRSIQKLLKKWLGLATIVPIGRGIFQYTFGFVERRRKVVTVVGVPLDVPKVERPTREQVSYYHAEFMKRLVEMFDEQKVNYLDNPENKHIVIL